MPTPHTQCRYDTPRLIHAYWRGGTGDVSQPKSRIGLHFTHEVHISRSLHSTITSRDSSGYHSKAPFVGQLQSAMKTIGRSGNKNANAHFTASQMVFVDETSKDERTVYRHYGRSVIGTRATIRANFVRGERYSMVCCSFIGWV